MSHHYIIFNRSRGATNFNCKSKYLINRTQLSRKQWGWQLLRAQFIGLIIFDERIILKSFLRWWAKNLFSNSILIIQIHIYHWICLIKKLDLNTHMTTFWVIFFGRKKVKCVEARKFWNHSFGASFFLKISNYYIFELMNIKKVGTFIFQLLLDINRYLVYLSLHLL